MAQVCITFCEQLLYVQPDQVGARNPNGIFPKRQSLESVTWLKTHLSQLEGCCQCAKRLQSSWKAIWTHAQLVLQD